MGRLACQITKSGKVAYIAGTEFPILSHHIKMSRQACEDIDKGDVEVIESYVGSWADPAKAKELAAAAIEQGVDVLILEADAGDPGTVEAALEAHENGEYIRVISWVKDKNYLAPDIVIGGWDERVPRLMEYATELAVTDQPGGHFAIGLAEEAVDLNPFYGLVPEEVETDIVTLLQEYKEDPANVPNLEVRTDL
jgi:basic membrane protein A